MTLENIKEIELNIDACILAYDEAVIAKNYEIARSAIAVMQFELKKLDENKIVIRTENYVN